MAHFIEADRLSHLRDLDAPAISQARVELSACLRMAAALGMAEGICNHFSSIVPGHPDLFLVNPLGLAFDEVGPDDLLICDFEGHVLSGFGKPEATAFFIHAELHKRCPRVVAAFHTHMPNATALAMTAGEPLAWAGQTALKFFGRVATLSYNGLALDHSEGARIAQAVRDADVLLLENHGVLVVGKTIAEAWDDLYYFERAAEVQIRAESRGRPLVPVPDAIAKATRDQMVQGEAESARLHLDRVIRASGSANMTGAMSGLRDRVGK